MSALEPLLGGSLAINLAYLNLATFRYRDQLAEAARSKLTNAPATVFETDWYKDIKSLADQTSTDSVRLRWHRSSWGTAYFLLFHWQIDRAISVLMTGVSVLYLFLGVAHNVGMFPESHSEYVTGEIHNELAYSMFGLLWPILMVLSAKYCTWKCQRFIKYQLEGIAKEQISGGNEDIDQAIAELDAHKAYNSLD
ncbi:hypothetical protein [Tateyamaria sp.]|uniref:hypothetical protein n=1 Tax=Tateyamaria sp. TaxID=1929288 RepID=UPI00329BB674